MYGILNYLISNIKLQKNQSIRSNFTLTSPWYGKTRVTSLRVAIYELRVASLKAQVQSLKARVKIQKCEFKSSRVTSSNPRVQESLNQWKLKQTAFKFILEIKK